MKQMRGLCGVIAVAMAAGTFSAFADDWTVDLRSRGVVAREAGGEKGLVRRVVVEGKAPVAPKLAPGDTVTLLLFDDTRLEVRLDEEMEAPLTEGRVFTGTLKGGTGGRMAVIIAGKDGLTATVAGVSRGHVVRVFRTDAGTVVEERDPIAEPSRGAEAAIPQESAQLSSGKSAARDQNDQVVDVLVAYEKGARDWVAKNGGTTNFAETAVQRMNAALANTGLDKVFRFRLVGVTEVDATVSSVSSALNAAQAGTGVWSALHAKRDETGADVVSVLIDNGSAYGTTGQGYSLKATTASAAARFSEYPYNACLVRSVAVSDTMTHETGHNLGCGHSNTQSSGGAGPQSFPYSSGYHFTGADGVRYHTVMAYYTDGNYHDYKPVPFFSSPEFQYAGVPVGTASANDNTRVLRQTFAWAGAWRERKIPLSQGVTFTPAGGTVFPDSVTVTLAPERTGLPIRYTLDGSDPTDSSPLYDGPITLTRTTTISAAVVTDDGLGPVARAVYSLIDIGDALDAPQLEWRNFPTQPWVFQTEDTFDGVDAVQSTDNGESWSDGAWIETSAEGPTTMSFRYKMRTGTGSFSVLVDGMSAFSDSRSGISSDDWHLGQAAIPEGEHTVRFLFAVEGLRNTGFNGAWLDAVRFTDTSPVPSFEPATGTDMASALVFSNSLTVAIVPPPGHSGAIYYTLDGSDPSDGGGIPYDGPLTLTATTHIRAVFEEEGMDPSDTVEGMYVEKHPVRAGEWTTDVEGVREAAARDGVLIAVCLADVGSCSWSQAFEPVAESAGFLAWAEANGVYLVSADSSLHEDTEDARSWFLSLWWALDGGGGSIAYPTLMFARPSAPDTPVGTGTARNNGTSFVGTVLYDGTAESLVAGFASVLGSVPPASPVAVPAGGLVDALPVSVELSNPGGSGTIRWTTDGSAPTRTGGNAYAGPIEIASPATVLKAAVWGTVDVSSPVLALSFTTVGDVLGTRNVHWKRSGTGQWRVEEGESRTLRAGGLMDGTYAATLTGIVQGKGKLVFSYRFTSYSWQNSFEFSKNGASQFRYAYDGTTSRSGTVTNEVESGGTTTFTWTCAVNAGSYDFGTGYSPQAGAWLSGVRWIPERDGVEVEGVFMDAEWFAENFPGASEDAEGREALAREDTDGDGFANWAECLCGTDPNDPSDCLRATIRMENGKAVIGWNLASPMEGAGCVVEGVPALPAEEAAWSEEDLARSSFFRIRVAKPGSR